MEFPNVANEEKFTVICDAVNWSQQLVCYVKVYAQLV